MTVVDQALKSYETAKRVDNHQLRCISAYCVAQAFLGPASKEQFRGPTTTDLDSYRRWQAIATEECAAVGMVPSSE